ncbi:MAG: hypothetical protein AAGG75_09290 [Bacteroidota bacterium]
MLDCQKHLFRLPKAISYLNGAYFSPLLIKSEQAVLAAMQLMSQPFRLSTAAFFEPVQHVKALFAQLINAESADRICLIPAVSYSIGLAYLGPYFDQGRPIEDSWLNRVNSDDFSQLVNYQPTFRPGAARYSVGEHASMLNIAILEKALEQLLEWQVPQVQVYCQRLVRPFADQLRAAGGRVEEDAYRVDHLFGVQMPQAIDPTRLHQRLKKQHIHVSLRGTTLRISPNVYNESQDLERLVQEIERAAASAELA